VTTTPHPVPPAPQAAPRRLVRRSDDRMLGGVCSGLADYAGMDVTLVRVLTVLAAVLGFGTVIVAYIVAWLLVPLDRNA
jgi:phage shock protein C